MDNIPVEAASEPSILLVCALGVGVVFVGLILLVGIVSIMNMFFRKNSEAQNTQAPVITPTVNAAPAERIENKQEILAAVCAAIAEENGTDISAIRVLSFKKI